MEPEKLKIAERVMKLFSLGDATKNQSEAEVQLAITKARELMMEHDLSLADIESLGTSKAKKVVHIITQTPVYTLRQRFALYDDYIAAAVETITDTENYIRNFWQHSQRYWQRVFVGTETDVAVAKELFMVLLDGMRRRARDKYGKGWSKKHIDYCLGYSYALVIKARQAYRDTLPAGDQKSVALAIIADKKAARETYTKKLNLTPGKKRRMRVHADAWAAGEQDGNLVDITAPERGIK